jgi:hypothetical protein
MTVYNYPAPHAPSYKKPTSVKDCLLRARRLVSKITPSEKIPFSVLPQLYVRDGDKVLIVTLPDQLEYISEAVTQVLMDQGARKVDFIVPQELGVEKCKTYSIEDGWRELDLLVEGKASGTNLDLLTGLGLGDATREYLDKNPGYTSVFLDCAGANAKRALGNHFNKWRGFWPFNNWEWFLSRAQSFPFPLLNELERRTVEPLEKASAVRITDPEGTYLEYSLTAEQAKRWQVCALVHGHLLMDPLMATSGELRRLGTLTSADSLDALDAPPVFHDLNGVLAGTANHCGFIPRIECHFEHSRLVEVRGGGRYGEGIRELMDRYKDIQWPRYPDKGYFWFVDCALCTVPGAFRRTSDMFDTYWLYPNLPERTRAGVFHMGFGSRISSHEKEFREYAEKNNLPRGHIHVHNYFATFEIKLRGTNYWHKLVDKGYMTALSDPDLRATATRYGDPDKLLSYDWIPPLPGINCEGSYLKDYAPDPITYLKKRIGENKPI